MESPKLPTPDTASPDTVRAMSLDLFFDYLGMRFNGEKAADAKGVLNFDFGPDGGLYKVEMENGVLNHTKGVRDPHADATVTLSRDTLNKIILQQVKLEDAIQSGQVKVAGNGGQA